MLTTLANHWGLVLGLSVMAAGLFVDHVAGPG